MKKIYILAFCAAALLCIAATDLIDPGGRHQHLTGVFIGTFTGDGSGLTNLPSSGGGGNSFPLTNTANMAGFGLTNGSSIQLTNTLTTGGLVITGLPGGTNTVDWLNVSNTVYSGNSVVRTGGTYAGDGSGLTNLAAIAIPYRADTTNIGNLATSLLITFSSPLPSTNYQVFLTFDSTLAAAVTPGATAKTTNGFTLTLSAGITGGANVDYGAFLKR